MGRDTTKPKKIEPELAVKEVEDHILKTRADQAIAFCMVFKEDDSLILHSRRNQPCYGEMRPYKATHPDMLPEHQRPVRKPGDLYNPFPDGEPTMLGVCFHPGTLRGGFDKNVHNEFYEAFFSETSPYRKGYDGVSLVKDTNGLYRGVINTSSDFDPTVFVAGITAFRNLVYGWDRIVDAFIFLRKELPDLTDNQRILLLLRGAGNMKDYIKSKTEKPKDVPSWYQPPTYRMQWPSYYLSANTNIERFLNGDAEDLTGGTWRERYAYNRPKLMNVFVDSDLQDAQPRAAQVPYPEDPKDLNKFFTDLVTV